MSDSTAEPHPAASLPPCRKCRSVTWEHTEGCWWGEYDEDSCSHCGGDSWAECGDPIQCTDPSCDGTMHPCPACQATGLESRQVIW